jgi:hypothetical protein
MARKEYADSSLAARCRKFMALRDVWGAWIRGPRQAHVQARQFITMRARYTRHHPKDVSLQTPPLTQTLQAKQ